MAPCGTNRDGSLYIKRIWRSGWIAYGFCHKLVFSQFATLEIAAATAKEEQEPLL